MLSKVSKPFLVPFLGASHCPRRMAHLGSQTYRVSLPLAQRPEGEQEKELLSLETGKKRQNECGNVPGTQGS